MTRRSFLAELKRRNVYRAAAIYAASAWLLVQVAGQVLSTLHGPEWVLHVSMRLDRTAGICDDPDAARTL